jgi:hypothetical protein
MASVGVFQANFLGFVHNSNSRSKFEVPIQLLELYVSNEDPINLLLWEVTDLPGINSEIPAHVL